MRPKITVYLLMATGWKQICAMLGSWSKGWIFILMGAPGWVLLCNTQTTPVCYDLEKTK